MRTVLKKILAGAAPLVVRGAQLVPGADPLGTWTWRNRAPLGPDVRGFSFVNDRFVALGGGGEIFTSPDGMTWTQQPSTATGQTFLPRGVAMSRQTIRSSSGRLSVEWTLASLLCAHLLSLPLGAADSLESLKSDGIAAIRQHRAALASLIETDPERALASAVPVTVRQRLPAAIANELENRVTGIGDLVVVAADPIPGGRIVEPFRRFVHLHGRTYRAHVYGRRIGETTKYGISLHGVAVGDRLALHEQALRELEPGEMPDSAKPLIDLRVAPKPSATVSSAILAELDGNVYRFGSRAELRAAEARLEALEASVGPYPTRPAVTVLEETIRSTGQASNEPVAPVSWTTGNKGILIIRVDFSDLTGDPAARDGTVYTAAYVQNLVDTQITPYYQQSSYGLTTLSNTVTAQLYRMPQTAAYYATNNFSDSLHTDAEAAAAADYAVTNYDRVIVLFSALDGISGSELKYGGLANVGGRNIWLNGECDFRSMSHELGHTFGLYHANLWQVNDGNPISPAGADVDAGDLFDTMGANFANDPRTDFNPWFKTLLGWIAESQVRTITNSGVYRIDRFDNSTGAGTLALKVAQDSQRDYWIGIRRKFTTNGSMQHGAYIIWGYHIRQTSDLLDLTTPGNSVQDAALAVGATFSDPTGRITIRPVAEGGTAPDEYLAVEITLPPVITKQPTNQAVAPGESAGFSVGANGNPAPTYQWQREAGGASNWNNLVDDTTYIGSTAATLIVSNAVGAMNGDRFQCVVGNFYGSVTSGPPAVLTVAIAPPVILMQPGNQAVAPGQPAVFTVAAIGAPPPTYQWQRRGAGDGEWTNLIDDLIYNGSTTPQLTVSQTTTAMSGGSFRCVITNPSGSVTTDPPALLSVNIRLVVESFVGLAGAYGATDGTGTNARFGSPFGIAGGGGNLYVADTYNHTIRKITAAGAASTLAGQPRHPGNADGTGSNAQFDTPFGVAVDSGGNVYVADTGNDAIRKITPTGGVTTLAGQAGKPGSVDGVGTNAQFNAPFGVAVDSNGNVYVADQGNNTIRKVTAGGIVTTLAGSAGIAGSADGTGNRAQFFAPFGVAVNNVGTVYVADTGNNTIRQITADGAVITLAGLAGAPGDADGLGHNARFNGPFGVAADHSSKAGSTDAPGDLYVADTYNQTIRKITPSGLVTTVAGLAGNGGSDDGAGSNARFYHPSGIAVDSAGNLYIADSGNNLIRFGQFVLLPPPVLEITNVNRQIVLSWPALATGFVLESAGALNPPPTWIPLTNGVGLVGDRFVLTHELGGPASFFRLRQP